MDRHRTRRSAALGPALAATAQVIAAALLVASGAVIAQTAGKPSPPVAREAPSEEPATSIWNTHTRARTPKEATPTSRESTLGLTVYRGLVDGVTLPGYIHPPERRGAVYSTDVTAIITRCTDGRRLITALMIGGQLTSLNNRCDQSHGNAKGPAKTCDADTWTCR